MRTTQAITLNAVEAACTLHSTLPQWRRTDDALVALRNCMPGFDPASTLIKVVAVNALYYTDVAAVSRIADHFSSLLEHTDTSRLDASVVEQLARVPRGGNEKRDQVRLSLASKFAHFFIDDQRFPIYDYYAYRTLARHTGRTITSLKGDYVMFAKTFHETAKSLGLTGQHRKLDRYLWIEGQYQEWRASGKASNGDLNAAFQVGTWPVGSKT